MLNLFSALKEWKIFQNNEQNASIPLKKLIKILNIKVTNVTVDSCLSNHPEYDSLLSISDCLNKWNIPNESYKLDHTDFSTENLSYPFIAHLPEESGRFILVEDIIGDAVKYSGRLGTDQILTKDSFLARWSGIILYAQKTEDSGEKNYLESFVHSLMTWMKLPFLVLLCVLALANVFAYSEFLTISYYIITVIKLGGVFVSVLLVIHSINVNNPFIKNLCSFGKKLDCNAILKSEAANITSWLSWSEIGMFYFLGSFLCLLCVPTSIILLKYFNVICLPYTVYSIIYQFRRRNWCILCCTVQVLLWLEGLIFFLNFSFSIDIYSFKDIIGISLAFLFPVASWSVLKPLLMKAQQSHALKQQERSFKFNSVLFNQLLTSQNSYVIPEEIVTVKLGNPNAENVITMVSNPFCGPCAKAHKVISRWIQNRDDIRLNIIFSTGNSDDDPRTVLSRHMGAIAALKDDDLLEKALSSWYFNSYGKYESWAEKYPVSISDEMIILTGRQKQWCKAADIRFTPTIFINGYKMPDPYKVEDIEYLIG